MLCVEDLGDDFVLEDDLTEEQAIKIKKFALSPEKREIWEVRIADQWDPSLHSLITKCSMPNAICGLMTCALSPILANNYPCDLTECELAQMIREMRKLEHFYEPLEHIAQYLHFDRKKYVETHPEEFESDEEKLRYLKDWVANYEISDYMSEHMTNPSVHFIRRIEKCPVKHEEHRRLTEEIPFKDLDFFVESLRFNEEKDELERFLQSPADWNRTYSLRNPKNLTFVLDTLGHFVLLKPIVLKKEEHSVNILLLMNTSKGLQITKRKAMENIFTMVFD